MPEMLSKLYLLALLGLSLGNDDAKNSKRSLHGLSLSPWSSVLDHPWAQNSWHPNAIAHDTFNSFPTGYHGKGAHYNTANDIAAAVAAAKEAAAAAALAHQRVQAAREQVMIQERVAAAKEAAAHAAIQRSEAAAHIAAAIQRSEALAAAAAAVQKSAAASAASAAAVHASGHFSSGPWPNSKSGYNHWG